VTPVMEPVVVSASTLWATAAWMTPAPAVMEARLLPAIQQLDLQRRSPHRTVPHLQGPPLRLMVSVQMQVLDHPQVGRPCLGPEQVPPAILQLDPLRLMVLAQMQVLDQAILELVSLHWLGLHPVCLKLIPGLQVRQAKLEHQLQVSLRRMESQMRMPELLDHPKLDHPKLDHPKLDCPRLTRPKLHQQWFPRRHLRARLPQMLCPDFPPLQNLGPPPLARPQASRQAGPSFHSWMAAWCTGTMHLGSIHLPLEWIAPRVAATRQTSS